MRHDRLHRHFECFGKLVFVKSQAAFFLYGLNLAGGEVFGFAGVGNNFAVFDFNHAVGLRGDFGIVRHHDDGVAVVIKLADDFHHVFTTGGIECAGGFVCKDDFAAVHQCAGDGHALLLPAGKFAGFVFFFAPQAEFVQKPVGTFVAFVLPHACINGRQGNVVSCGHGTEQVIALENKAEAFAAHGGKLVCGHFGGFRAGDGVGSISGCVQQPQDIHQRGFA